MDKKSEIIRIDSDLAKILKKASEKMSKQKGVYVSPGKILKERYKDEF